MLEIEKILNVSTAHVSQETAKKLEAACGPHADSTILSCISVFDKTDFGWWIWVDRTQIGAAEPNLLTTGQLPADLWGLMCLAKENDCNWLCLDCDGPEIGGYPTYEW